LALDIEVADQELAADRALPAALLRLDQLEPALITLVEEAGADLARILDLVMAVIGGAQPQADTVEKAAAGIHLAAHVEAGLADVEADILVRMTFMAMLAFFFALLMLVLMHVEARGHAVEA